ncbi:MAG: SRPBCC domain-containing protein, partial [Actinomycetota bacterium]
MSAIHTEIDIEGSIEDVWQVLTEFDRYPEWNPFIRSIDGTPEAGERITAMLGATGKKPFRISPTVQAAKEPTRFAWLGSLGMKGIFDGHHQFEIVPTDSGAHFRHYEEFSGILSPLILSLVRKSTTRGFNEMNEALKTRV